MKEYKDLTDKEKEIYDAADDAKVAAGMAAEYAVVAKTDAERIKELLLRD